MSAAASRRPVVAANWKMHLLAAEARAWCRAVLEGLEGWEAAARVLVFPSFPLVPAVVEALAGSAVEVGGQDLHPADRGAHTGDVSGPQLADAGCAWALCGHSERRRDHGEADELVGRKAAAALRHGLSPLVCIGETGDERRAGATLAVLERQVRAALSPLVSAGGGGLPERLALAYEPVWAIGTGATATPDTAQEAQAFVRRVVEALAPGAGGRLPILYGGSVTPDNAAELAARPDVAGFLVGGASLDPAKFLAIIYRSAAV